MTAAQKGPYTGTMNGSGAMSVALPDNSFITPPGSQWLFILCPNASAPCSQVTLPAIGSTVNYTSQFSAAVTAPRFSAFGSGAFGYSTVEVIQIPPPGANFWNVTSACTEIWTGSAFTCSGIGGGSVTLVTFPTSPSWLLGSVANGSTTPAISLVSQSGQTSHQVIGTCGSATTFAPCALVAGDLPSTAVTPGSYTSANITVDAQGRITAAANGSGGGGGFTAGGDLSGSNTSQNVIGLETIPLPTLAASTGYLYDSAGALSLSTSASNLTSGTLPHAQLPALVSGDIPNNAANTTGSAAKWTTARTLAGNSVDGSANVAFSNKFIVQGTTDAGLSGAQFLGALATGILKNTNSTGVLSIAIAADFPTLNQSTTGNAATATALASTPSLCSPGNAPTGVLANGNATGCAALGGLPSLPTSPNSVPQTLISTPSGGVGGAAAWGLPGVITRAVIGTTATDTILATDCTPGRVAYQGSVAVAVTLPTATTLAVPNCIFRIANNTSGSSTAVTVTPTTWTVRGGSSIIIAQGQVATFAVDPAGTSWDVDVSDEALVAGTGITIARGQYGPTISSSSTTPAYPLTVTGGVAGAVTCFTSTTTEVAGTLLASNALVVGGGSSACPATGNGDFTYATHTLTGGASGILDLSAMAPTAGLKLPSAAGAVPTADGFIAVNTTNHALVVGSNGTTIVEAAAATGTNTATTCSNQLLSAISAIAAPTCTTVTGAMMASNTVTATQLAAQYSKGSCTELWGGSGTSFALTSGDDAVSNNSCYNDSGVTRTITAVKCRGSGASNTTTVNPTFGSAGTGTTILSGALTCGSSLAYSSTGTVSNASWTTGTGITPAMGGTLTGTSIAMIVEYTY